MNNDDHFEGLYSECDMMNIELPEKDDDILVCGMTFIAINGAYLLLQRT